MTHENKGIEIHNKSSRNQVANQMIDGPRERIKSQGVTVLSSSELVAAIIGTGSKDVSVMELSRQLVESLAEGLPSLESIGFEELTAIKGIGTSKACQLMACIELGRRVYSAKQQMTTRITNPSDIASLLMTELRYKKQEIFKVIYLNTKNHIIGIETITVGTLNASLVHPREVFSKAIRRASYAIVLAHNHPSGNPEPSPEDIHLTERMVQAGELLGIQVLDHVVIGNGIHCSLKERGLM